MRRLFMDDHRSENEQTNPEQASGVWTEGLDSVEALVVVLDRGGRIVRVNQTFAESVGCSRPDLEGCELWELVEADQVDTIKRLFSAKNPFERPHILRLRWLSDDNHQQPIVWSFSPLRDDEAQPGFAFGVGLALDDEDLTAILSAVAEPLTAPEPESPPSAETEQPESIATPPDTSGGPRPDSSGVDMGELIRPLVEHSSDIICVLDPDGTLAYVSPSVNRVLGHRPEELLGTNAFELVHPDDLQAVAPIIERGLKEPGRVQQVECRARHADGSWWMVQAQGIAHSKGDSTRVIVTITDISDRKQAEQALVDSEERFRSAFENMAIGKVLWAPDGRIVRANRAVLDLLGYEEQEMLTLSNRARQSGGSGSARVRRAGDAHAHLARPTSPRRRRGTGSTAEGAAGR
jgi:PAS domain S-box-containing protein